MGFNASFQLVVCLLVIIGNAVFAQKNGRGEKQDLVSKYDNSWWELHDISRNLSSDEELSARNAVPIDLSQFFLIHAPEIEPQRKQTGDLENWSEYAAIWVVKETWSAFRYSPKLNPNSPKNLPLIDISNTCSPPLYVKNKKVLDENYLAARPTQMTDTQVDHTHAEANLYSQVKHFDDLLVYVRKNKPVKHVIMFSFKHPCHICAGLLIEILDLIEEANGETEVESCYLGYAKQLRQGDKTVLNSDAYVRENILGERIEVLDFPELKPDYVP